MEDAPTSPDPFPLPPVNADGNHRRNQLLSNLKLLSGMGTPQPSEVVNRILDDLNMTVECQAKVWGPLCQVILDKPVPYDTANHLKPAMMAELMPSVGDNVVNDVWRSLQLSFVTRTQAAPIVVVLGTSGMGKTKCAYDIGLQHAFVVITRIVEKDICTPPWEDFLKLTHEIVRTSNSTSDLPPLSERHSIKLIMIVLIAAHLEWAVAVSEEALKHPAFANTTYEERVPRLREIVLRAQRNGLVYSYITYYFRRAMRDIIIRGIREDGRLDIDPPQVNHYYLTMTNRANQCWGHDARMPARIVFAYDEAQALLDGYSLPKNICEGVSGMCKMEPAGSAVCCSLYYGLLAAIRHMQSEANAGHLILGNSFDLNHQPFNNYTTPQRTIITIDKAVHLNAADIRTYLAHYLKPSVIACISEDQLHQLSGRPLFASRF